MRILLPFCGNELIIDNHMKISGLGLPGMPLEIKRTKRFSNEGRCGDDNGTGVFMDDVPSFERKKTLRTLQYFVFCTF